MKNEKLRHWLSCLTNSIESLAQREKAIQIPTDLTAEVHQAVALTSQGKLAEAEAIYRALITAERTSHVIYGNLAAVCGMQGKLEEAVGLLNQALKFKSDYPEAHNNLGNALMEKGNIDAAIGSYNSALKLKPNWPEAHNNLGSALKNNGDLKAAITSYKTALKLKYDYPEAHYNLGVALQENGNLNSAIASYSSALKLKPNWPEAHNNLANALRDNGELDAAITSYNAALKLKPDSPEAYYNLGAALHENGNLNSAIASYSSALKLKTDWPEAHAATSLCLLTADNYKSGLETYEWRFKTKKPSLSHSNPICPHLGNNKLTNINSLLLVTEQGFGDTLQFMRYALALKQQGIHTSLCAQPKLHSLIQASGIDTSPLTPDQASQITEGHWLPLLSLPKYLSVSPDNPIITEPYIQSSDELNSKWQTILSAEQRPIIGINWQGNQATEKITHRGRSIPLETFGPITTHTNSTLLSLQKGFGSDQLDNCSFKERFVSCQDQINDTWDFLETAAIITNCDLIITSDTAVAHLAAGMGKTTWLLLSKVPDWRWGLKGDSTFWYPSMRLFRQHEKGNWNEVLQRVKLALQQQFDGSTGLTQTAETPSPDNKLPLQSIQAPI